MTEVEALPEGRPKVNTLPSINDEFDVSTLPDFDTPSIGPLNALRSNSLIKTRSSSSIVSMPQVSLAMSSSTTSTQISLSQRTGGPISPRMLPPINAQSNRMEESRFVPTQSRPRSPAIIPQKGPCSMPCSPLLSSSTSIAEYMCYDNKTCKSDMDIADEELMASVDVADSRITPAYGITTHRPTNTINGMTVPLHRSLDLCPNSTLQQESTSTFITDDHKDTDFEDSESEDDPLYAITPRTSGQRTVCESTTSPTMSPLTINDTQCLYESPSMRLLKLNGDGDGDSNRASIKRKLAKKKSLREAQRRKQSKNTHFESNRVISSYRAVNGTLWGRKMNSIPSKHGQQQIVEWKFATLDGDAYRGHTMVLHHEQIRRKRKSKRMIMLDGNVIFCEKTKRTEWKQIRIPYCNHTLHVMIEEKNVNHLKYNYRLIIDAVAYSVAFCRWQQEQRALKPSH